MNENINCEYFKLELCEDLILEGESEDNEQFNLKRIIGDVTLKLKLNLLIQKEKIIFQSREYLIKSIFRKDDLLIITI